MFVWIIAVGAALLFLAVVLAIVSARWRLADRVGRWCLYLGLLLVAAGGFLQALDAADARLAAHVEASCRR